MILDKLIEKKDILAYIDMRKKYLCENYKNIINDCKPRHRSSIHSQWKGRIKELNKLKEVINNSHIKEMSKLYWNNCIKEVRK